MYENNYNYNNTYADITPKKKSGAGKVVAGLLAVAVVGGASGFGGAYLQNKLNPVTVEVQEAPAVTTAVSTPTPTISSAPSDTAAVNLLDSGASNGELSTKQIVKKVTPSVVSVRSEFTSGSQQGSGTGTGIILSSDGYIITNAHVVQADMQEWVNDDSSYNGGNNYGFGNDYDDIFGFFFGGGNSFGNGGNIRTVTKNADKVTIVLSDDSEKEYTAEIVGADKRTDLAVLKIDSEGKVLQAAEFGDSDKLEMGDTAVAIGYPMGLGLSTSQGIISGLDRTLSFELSSGGSQGLTLIQTDTPINPGNSGGPLINAYGQVVGITSSKLADNEIDSLGFAIPITDAMPIISDLMNKGYVTTPQIGITGTDINNAIQRYYGLPVNAGVMVVSVEEGSAAEAAGLCAGDVIIAADGEEVSSMDKLTEIKSRKKVGDEMVLTLARANGNVDVTITLGSSEDVPPAENTENAEVPEASEAPVN